MKSGPLSGWRVQYILYDRMFMNHNIKDSLLDDLGVGWLRPCPYLLE